MMQFTKIDRRINDAIHKDSLIDSSASCRL